MRSRLEFIMNNKRTTTVLGATIASIGLVFGLIFAMPGVTEEVSATSALMGHVTTVITQPDGSTNYMQSDNQIQLNCLADAAFSLLSGFTGTQSGPYVTLAVYTNTVPAVGAAVGGGTLTPTLTLTSAGQISTQASGASTLTVRLDFGTLTAVTADNFQSAKSVGLVNAAGTQACSIVLLTCPIGGCPVATGTTFVIDYDLSFT